MKKALLISLLFFVSSCNLEPRYVRPYMDIPQCWRFESEEGSTCANVRWWDELGDPILDALIVEALNNNKDLQIAVWRVCEYLGRYMVAKSPLYPQVELEGEALKRRYPVNTSFLPIGFNPITPYYEYAFNFNWELDIWGLIKSQTHAAFAEWAAQIENRRFVILNLVSEVAKTYISLRELDKELEISKKTLQSRKESLDIAKDRYAYGETSEVEVTQAIAIYEETMAEIVRLERDIPIKEDLLSLLIGLPPTCILRGKALEDFCLPPEIPAGLPSDLLVRRPDILQAEDQLIAANAEIGVARAEFFPQVSLTGLFGGQSFQLNQLFNRTSRAWQIGGKFLQPIFEGGKLIGQLKVANAAMMEALYHYEEVILNAFREVSDALISHAQAKKEVEIQISRVQDLKLYLELSWLRYNEGQTEYLTFLDAERQLFRAEIDLAKAQGDVFLTLVELYKSLGGGWVIDADYCIRS